MLPLPKTLLINWHYFKFSWRTAVFFALWWWSFQVIQSIYPVYNSVLFKYHQLCRTSYKSIFWIGFYMLFHNVINIKCIFIFNQRPGNVQTRQLLLAQLCDFSYIKNNKTKCQHIKIKCNQTVYDIMTHYQRSQRNHWVYEIILEVTTCSHYFWFWVLIIFWNLSMCIWWQYLWQKGLLSCCLFPPKIKLTQFHNVIIPQLPYNRRLRRLSYQAITGRNDILECHLSFCYLLHSEHGEYFSAFFPESARW